MNRDGDGDADIDIDDSSENVLSEWPRAVDEPGDEPTKPRAARARRPDLLTQRRHGRSQPPLPRSRSPSPSLIPIPIPIPSCPSRRRSRRDSEPLESEPDAESGTAIAVPPSLEHAAGDLEIPEGYAVLEGVPDGGRRAVGLVVSRFNGNVTSRLLDRALEELEAAGVRRDAITIMVVPGAFELPVAATALAKTRRFACIVALGCVIRGDTPHFDYVASEAASGLQLAALETGRSRLLRPPDARSRRAGRAARREGRRGRAQRARDGRRLLASSGSRVSVGATRRHAARRIRLRPPTARPGTMLGRMSKVCAICGKKPGFGNNRSHSMVATRRRFNPNLQRVRVLLEGHPTRAYVCTRCLKAGKVQKAL